jgi:hypothetical protein
VPLFGVAISLFGGAISLFGVAISLFGVAVSLFGGTGRRLSGSASLPRENQRFLGISAPPGLVSQLLVGGSHSLRLDIKK